MLPTVDVSAVIFRSEESKITHKTPGLLVFGVQVMLTRPEVILFHCLVHTIDFASDTEPVFGSRIVLHFRHRLCPRALSSLGDVSWSSQWDISNLAL